jgi:hypothetical protein
LPPKKICAKLHVFHDQRDRDARPRPSSLPSVPSFHGGARRLGRTSRAGAAHRRNHRRRRPPHSRGHPLSGRRGVAARPHFPDREPGSCQERHLPARRRRHDAPTRGSDSRLRQSRPARRRRRARWHCHAGRLRSI